MGTLNQCLAIGSSILCLSIGTGPARADCQYDAITQGYYCTSSGGGAGAGAAGAGGGGSGGSGITAGRGGQPGSDQWNRDIQLQNEWTMTGHMGQYPDGWDPTVLTWSGSASPTVVVGRDGSATVDALGVAAGVAATASGFAAGNTMGVVAGMLGTAAAVTNAVNDGYGGGMTSADAVAGATNGEATSTGQ